MPVEDVFSIQGSWYRRHARPSRARSSVDVGEEDRDRRPLRRIRLRRRPCTGVEMFNVSSSTRGPGWRQLSACLLRGIEKEDVERGQVLAEARRSTASARQVHRRGDYVPTKEEGGRHTPFFKGLPAPVLLPYHRRDWFHPELVQTCSQMVHAWRQHQHDRRPSITAHRHGQRASASQSARADRTVGSPALWTTGHRVATGFDGS